MRSTLSLLSLLALLLLTGCPGDGAEADVFTIAVQEGTTGENAVREKFPKAKLLRFAKVDQACVAVQQGKADAVVFDHPNLMAYVRENPEQGLEGLWECFTSEPIGAAFHQKSLGLVAAFDATLARMKKDGSYDKLVKKYFPEGNLIEPKDEVAPTKAPENKDDVAKVKERGTLRVAMDAGYVPFEVINKDGSFSGFDVDLINEVAKDLGVKVEIKNVAWTGIIGELQTGKVDVIISGMSITDERKKAVAFSQPYFHVGQVVVKRKGDKRIMSWKDLAGSPSARSKKSGSAAKSESAAKSGSAGESSKSASK